METIALQSLGVAIFFGSSVRLGRMIRRKEHKSVAVRFSRLSHLLFWLCLLAPGLVGFFYPGLTRYDELLGIPSLPFRSAALVVGLVLLSSGFLLVAISNHTLAKMGRGGAAFLLTEQVVREGIYKWTRNPMSLGFYMMCFGVGLVAGSTFVALGALLIVIPVHVVNLRYFEERELEIRYGSAYLEYKKQTPFLFPRIGRH
jgi:protein-S-isoprenylcysteine O-methyltransferase Ste14